jgi:small subunit ribosomal protein S21
MAEVKIKKGGSVEHALRILRKKVDREGTLKTVRKKRYYEKKSDRRYRKASKAKYIAKIVSEENRRDRGCV